MSDTDRVHLKVSPSMHQKLKMLAAYEGLSMIEMLEKIINDRFKKTKLPEPKTPKKTPKQLTMIDDLIEQPE